MGGNESVGGHDIAICERIHGEIWMVFRRDYLCLPITEFICRPGEAVWLARKASFFRAEYMRLPLLPSWCRRSSGPNARPDTNRFSTNPDTWRQHE